MIKCYAKGVRKELKFVNEAKQDGLIAFRSAGSHSEIDVCIINIKERVIRFIQCKPDNFPMSQKLKLEEELSGINGGFFVRFEVL